MAPRKAQYFLANFGHSRCAKLEYRVLDDLVYSVKQSGKGIHPEAGKNMRIGDYLVLSMDGMKVYNLRLDAVIEGDTARNLGERLNWKGLAGDKVYKFSLVSSPDTLLISWLRSMSYQKVNWKPYTRVQRASGLPGEEQGEKTKQQVAMMEKSAANKEYYDGEKHYARAYKARNEPSIIDL